MEYFTLNESFSLIYKYSDYPALLIWVPKTIGEHGQKWNWTREGEKSKKTRWQVSELATTSQNIICVKSCQKSPSRPRDIPESPIIWLEVGRARKSSSDSLMSAESRCGCLCKVLISWTSRLLFWPFLATVGKSGPPPRALNQPWCTPRSLFLLSTRNTFS